MKKPNPNTKKWFRIRSKSEMAKRNKKRRRMRKSDIRFQTEDANPSNLSVEHAPDYMDLSPEYIKKCVNFFERVAKKDENFCIDFSEVKKIYVSATIALYSVIEELRAKKPGIKIYFNYKRKDKKHVRDVFENTGLEELARGTAQSSKKNTPLKITSIDAALSELEIHSTHAFEIIKSIDDKFFHEKMNKKQKGSLSRGIAEALLNVTDHAYDERDDEGLKKYWITAINLYDYLHIAIYDRGIGIPQSIRRKVEFLKWFSKDDKIKDSDLIAKAVQKDDEDYISRFRHKDKGKTNRGKGLKNISKVMKNFNMEAKLVIISGRGCYSELSDGREKREELDVSLQGTLIQWSMKLN